MCSGVRTLHSVVRRCTTKQQVHSGERGMSMKHEKGSGAGGSTVCSGGLITSQRAGLSLAGFLRKRWHGSLLELSWSGTAAVAGSDGVCGGGSTGRMVRSACREVSGPKVSGNASARRSMGSSSVLAMMVLELVRGWVRHLLA